MKGYESKKCFYCNSKLIQKYGVLKGIQRYKCLSCNKQFIGGKRVSNHKLWIEYTQGKQTYKQLAEKHNCSIKTIQRKLDSYKINEKVVRAREVVLLMDTTYFGRKFGVMVFKDAYTKENLLKYYVKTETNSLYIQGVNELITKGFSIKAIVCDGRKGLIQSFKSIPVQMCQFHQVAIIRRYLTKKPKLPASKELMHIVSLLKQTDKESFTALLSQWFDEWKDFLNERSINIETGKTYYTHKRLRSAFRSLNSNLPWLFTWYNFIDLNIPNTTNAIDGHFSDLKRKLGSHNGLSLDRKKKFIDDFLGV